MTDEAEQFGSVLAPPLHEAAPVDGTALGVTPTAAAVVEETALLIKAAALRIAAVVHDLLAQGERLLFQVSAARAATDATSTSEAALSSTFETPDPAAERDS